MHHLLQGTIQQTLLISLAGYLCVLELLISTSWAVWRTHLWEALPVSEHSGAVGEENIMYVPEITVDPPAHHSCVFKVPSLVADGLSVQVDVTLRHSGPEIDLKLAHQADLPCEQKLDY